MNINEYIVNWVKDGISVATLNIVPDPVGYIRRDVEDVLYQLNENELAIAHRHYKTTNDESIADTLVAEVCDEFGI